MSKHTPGPWRVVRANPSPTTGEWLIAGLRAGYLADVRDCGSGDVQANAALIAAAPELLAALQALLPAYREAVRLYDSNHDDAFTVRAHNAIVKATGVSYE